MSEPALLVPRRILIVDDAEEAREILAIALRLIARAEVETLDSGLAAVRRMSEARVDVLITDIAMQGVSGLDLLQILREKGCWPSRGVLVITGESDPELPSRALAIGATRIFSKPFSAMAVREAVISLLGGT